MAGDPERANRTVGASHRTNTHPPHMVAAAAGEQVPAAQSSHMVIPAMTPKDTEPQGTQSGSEVEHLMRQKVHAGHSNGDVMPGDTACVPGGQGGQLPNTPAVGRYVPIGQSKQALLPSTTNEPAVHVDAARAPLTRSTSTATSIHDLEVLIKCMLIHFISLRLRHLVCSRMHPKVLILLFSLRTGGS